jgi:prepilin-type N-terminal cleavage/methylation domain-containing protein/prepilin-type processing-associated H-X9-DG protein
MRSRHAFTLVELLVVIGIIALLIAILLPALQEARRSAATVKCGAHLRGIGQTFLLYAQDNDGFYPVASWQGGPYTLHGVTANTHIWNSFLGPYATTATQGTGSTSVDEAIAARDTIFWGCPEWEGYPTTALGGYDRTGIGYGMNPHPTFDVDTPTNSGGFVYNVDQPPYDERALIRQAGVTGRFMRAVQWTRPSERALVADSINWRIKAQPEPADGVARSQPTPDRVRTFTGNRLGQTLVDVYRHGRAPSMISPDLYAAQGGRIRYNILYADGHVETHTDMRPAFHSMRLGNTGN